MKIKGVRPESYIQQLNCDKCGRSAQVGDPEFKEFACIDMRAGYGSVFGDGNEVQIDLCQHCLKEALGQWLRVIEPGQRERELSERLNRFDPERHGGESPCCLGESEPSFVEPEQLHVQERRTLDGD